MAKKSWTDKLNDPKPHQVKRLHANIAGMKEGQMMLIPSPRIVDDFIRRIPSGKSMDVKTLREKLARKYKAEVTCPVTMGFHLRAVAEAAFESLGGGSTIEQITPFWRILDEKTPTTKKLSFDPAFVMEQREREGL